MEEEKPECFGFFMAGSNCGKCKLMRECFKKWKDEGEPSLETKPTIKNKFKCKCECE